MKCNPFRTSVNSALRLDSGFTLVELLVTLGIIGMLMLASGPAVQALSGAGSTTKAASDFSSVLTLARSFAVAQNTYVRVAIAEIATPGQEKLIVLPIFSADGSLEQGEALDMASVNIWPTVGRPLVLQSFRMAEGEVESALPATSGDDLTSASDIPNFRRIVPGVGSSPVNFSRCVQFDPSGEARIIKAIPSRHIKIPVDRVGARAGRNPFLLRVSPGNVRILRAGEGM